MFAEGALRPPGREMQVTDPWTHEIVGSVPVDSAEDVAAALHAMSAAWRPLPPAERAAVLHRAAALLQERARDFAVLITSESGVCIRETASEVKRAVANLETAAEEALRVRGETLPVPGHDRIAITVHEPIGIVAALTPFNRPLNQVVVKVAPAVAAGCAIAVKPSERTPLTALALAGLLIEAGLPPEALVVTTGAPAEVGPALTSHPAVDMVTFTGSVATGRSVAASAAGKKLLLELGGNDPLIVLPDADLDEAVRLAAKGAFSTAGQSCRGIKRVIAVGAAAEALGSRLAEAAGRLRAGDPREADTDLGPLVTEDAAREVEQRIGKAVAAGATLLCGGDRDAALLPPTVLDHVPPDATLVAEETFGPVAPVIRVPDVDAAIEVANSTIYGLQAGVLTRDVDDFWRIATGLRVGAVNLAEGPNFDSPHIPFGGVKASGVGREGMYYAVREMTALKTITMPYPPRRPQHDPGGGG